MQALNEANLAACALAACALVLAAGMVALAFTGHSIPAEIAVPASAAFGGLLSLARTAGKE